jgi:Na+/glutamate symporter
MVHAGAVDPVNLPVVDSQFGTEHVGSLMRPIVGVLFGAERNDLVHDWNDVSF